MRYVILLLFLLWPISLWGSDLDQQQTAILADYLHNGTVREKLLALSLLPKPNCGRVNPPESRMVLQAMTDDNPLVREMATFYVRYNITGEPSLPGRLSDEEYFPLSPLTPENNTFPVTEQGRGLSSGQRVSRGKVCGSQPVVEALLQASSDAIPRIRMESALGLGFVGDTRVVQTLVRLAKDADPLVRAAAAYALGEHLAKEEVQTLASLAVNRTGDWRDFFARREAFKALRKIWVAGFRRTVSIEPSGNIPHDIFDDTLRKLAIATALDTLDDLSVRREAYELLAEIKAPEALAVLRAGVADNDPLVREAALRSLRRIADDAACRTCDPIFTASAADKDARVRAAAVRGLGRIAGKTCNDTLLKSVDDPDENVRVAAVAALRCNDARSLEKLASALNDAEAVRSAALVSLYRATRTDADFAAVRERRRPAEVKPGRSYIWIVPDPDRMRPKTSVTKPAVFAKLHNNVVVERIMAVYPVLSQSEKMYALELLGRFEHPLVAQFLIRSIDDVDSVCSIKAMETAIAYAPLESIQVFAEKLASKNERISNAAYRVMDNIRVDFPIDGLAPIAEDPSPKTRWRFFNLVKRLSDPMLPPLCLKGLRDDDEAVRSEAAEYFQTHQDHHSVKPLTDMLKGTPSERNVAVTALAAQDESAFAPLLSVLSDSKGEYVQRDKIEALFGLVNYDRERTASALLDLLRKLPDPKDQVADNVIRALVGMKESRVVPLLLNYLSEDNGKWSIAVNGLFELADPSTSGPLRKIIEDPDQPLDRRRMAIIAHASGGADATRYLLALARRSPELRSAAVEYLQVQKPEDRLAVAAIAGSEPAEYRDILTMIGGAWYRIPVEQTSELLHSKDAYVVKGAVLLLRASGSPNAIDLLRGLVNDQDRSLQGISAEAVQYLERKKSEKELKEGGKV
jgi:HEAT repeat protein